MLLRNGLEVEETWIEIASDDDTLFDEELPAGDIIVPHGRLAAARQRAHDGRLGVVIDNDVDRDGLEALVGVVDLIGVRFPAYADGRGFSIAARLRSLGFTGTLRAVGPLIADQARNAVLSGFDEIQMDDAHGQRQGAANFNEAQDAFPAAYQDVLPGDASAMTSILRARRGMNGRA